MRHKHNIMSSGASQPLVYSFRHFSFMDLTALAKTLEAPTFIKMSCGSPGCTFLVSQMTLQSLHLTKTWDTGGPPTGKSGQKKLSKFTLPLLTMSITNHLNLQVNLQLHYVQRHWTITMLIVTEAVRGT